MRRLLRQQLSFLARLIIKKYHPVVIGITGSIGKTSTKEAIAAVLKDRSDVRFSQKNYNNEIGLPLTVIGSESAGRSILGWLAVIAKAWCLLLFRSSRYPHILVLEMGVDHPGDMSYLVSIAPPTIGIVTAVSYSHIEYFGSLANIQSEKQVLIESLAKKGLAILNYDNEATRKMAAVSHAKVVTYGLENGADFRAQDVSYNSARGNYEISGLNFKFNSNGSVVPVFMDNAMSDTAIYAALAAAAVGVYFEMNLVEIASALKDFSLPKGRMNLLPGIKQTFIIDDTYNSSPEAALAAIDVLGRIRIDAGAAKYAVLGDMLEIGSYTEEGHRSVGKKLVDSGINRLIAVGEKARDIIRGAKEAGLDDDYIFYFDNSSEAGKFLQDRLRAGDIILVKGSQGVRMERIVKEIMAEPERANELLVRQGKEWTDA